MTRSPIFWSGGKGKSARKIVPYLEQIAHTRYVEPFGGGASILLAKMPVDVETYNDIDNGLYDLFCVLTDPLLFRRFYVRVRGLPYSHKLYDDCRSSWRETDDLLERVVRWYVVARQSFGGRFGNFWGSVVTATKRGRAGTARQWQSSIRNLKFIHQRLQRVQIENADWRTIIARYDTPETLFYCDPPYVHDTRSSQRYEHELGIEDHGDLVDMLLNISGHAALSCYDHPVYAQLLENGWSRIEWVTACSVAGRTRATGILGAGSAMRMQKRTEVLYRSPGCSGVQQRLF